METLQQPAKAAIFVDAENQTERVVIALLQSLAHLNIVECHAFADWRNPRLTLIRQELERYGFQSHAVYSGERPGEQKDQADQAMACAVRALLWRRPEVEVIVLVTGDHYFVSLVKELQRRGKTVYVAASPMSVAQELYALAQQYLPLGQLAGWIRDLDVLEQRSRRLTLHFATQRSSISAENLERLIKCGILQKKQCPTRNGFEERIFLNRQARQVQMVLST